MTAAAGCSLSEIDRAIAHGLTRLEYFQTPEGSLRAAYDGPLFLVPGFVIACYVGRTALDASVSQGLIRYMCGTQSADGGFPLHVEGRSYLFTTVLNYVALRLLGVPSGATVAKCARRWIHQRGGAVGIPSWGKYWLALLRLYEWEGVNPVLPELLLAPRWFPIHPRRIWCHARVIYLAVSYLYGRRWRTADDPLLAQLRTEIYCEDYANIPFARHRNSVSATDLYRPPKPALRALNRLLGWVEHWIPNALRQRALDLALDHIKYGQRTTSFLDLGPVNKALNVVVCCAAEPDSAHTRQALDRMVDYLFQGEGGLSVQAYNSSEVWDTALCLQAIAAAGTPSHALRLAQRAYAFLDRSQIVDEVPDREAYFRDPSLGGWPFSNRAHGWPIVDCTAQALMVLLRADPAALAPIPAERLCAAVDLLLHWQNGDGGWPTYERCRGWQVMEVLNPSEMFGNVMVDRSSVELTSAAVQGLAVARQTLAASLGTTRLRRIHRAMHRGASYIRASQRSDGSWKGSWGICFTYGTWFGVSGLLSCGVPTSDAAVLRARDFLLSQQLADGGWGESFRSCIEDCYVQHPDGAQAVMTAWALLALLPLDDPLARSAIDRGAKRLLADQVSDGDWPQQSVAGVFNDTCMLNYRLYRIYFPIWALAVYRASERCASCPA